MKYEYNLSKKFWLVVGKQVLTLKVDGKEFTARYNIDIDLRGVPKGYYDLMMYILLYGLEQVDIEEVILNQKGDNSLISYSGGVDSSALVFAFKGIPIHIYRSYDQTYGEKQLQAVESISAYQIITDFERVRMLYVERHGFNVGVGYGAMYMPLMDYFCADKIMFGVVFDDLAFWYGKPFTYNENFEKSNLFKIREVLNRFGIDLVLPLAGYSEVLTIDIVDRSGLIHTSCHTKGYNLKCLECIKCFRKEAVRGNPIHLENPIARSRVEKLLTSNPLKMAAVTVYAIQKAGYEGLERFNDIDVSFCERVNRRMTNVFYKDEKLDEYEWQTDEDLKNIHKFVEFINNPELYKYE